MTDLDAQCHCERCESRTKETYSLKASCSNCGAGPFNVTFRKGDEADRVIGGLRCPDCGCCKMILINPKHADL